jgi:hypothetical protein
VRWCDRETAQTPLSRVREGPPAVIWREAAGGTGPPEAGFAFSRSATPTACWTKYQPVSRSAFGLPPSHAATPPQAANSSSERASRATPAVNGVMTGAVHASLPRTRSAWTRWSKERYLSRVV